MSKQFPNKGNNPIESEKVRYNGIDFSKSVQSYVMYLNLYLLEVTKTSAKSVLSYEDF